MPQDLQASISTTNPTKFEALTAFLNQGVDDGVFPGAVMLASKNGEIRYFEAVGGKQLKAQKSSEAVQPMTKQTVFDLGELTTVLITTTLAMKLVEEGKLSLDDKVCRYVQGFGVLGKSSVTIAQLLRHSSGLVHWVPFFEELLEAQSGTRRGIMASRGAKDYVINSINRMELKYQPGSKSVYSDVGFILLGHLLEILTGLSLDKAALRYVFQPLGLKSSSYIDLSMIRRRGIHPITDLIAPTEECAWRKRVLCGEVHDDNAWAMGGIAGHAGLFSNAQDLHALLDALLKSYAERGSFLKPQTIKALWQKPDDAAVSRLYGWDTPSRENGMVESGLTQTAVGMNSFSGCSVWLEPEEGLMLIMLSNRIHPSRANKKILSFRPEACLLVLKALREN